MKALVALALCLFALSLRAEEVQGRVRAIYYEAAPGVLVDSRFAHRPTAIRWADVDVGGRSVLAKMAPEVRAGIGERVAVRLANPKSTPLAQVLPDVATARALESAPESSTGR